MKIRKIIKIAPRDPQLKHTSLSKSPGIKIQIFRLDSPRLSNLFDHL